MENIPPDRKGLVMVNCRSRTLVIQVRMHFFWRFHGAVFFVFIQEMCFFPPPPSGYWCDWVSIEAVWIVFSSLPLRVSKLRHLRFAISVIRGEKGWRGTIAARFLLIALLTETKGVLTYLERNPTNAYFFMYCNWRFLFRRQLCGI